MPAIDPTLPNGDTRLTYHPMFHALLTLAILGSQTGDAAVGSPAVTQAAPAPAPAAPSGAPQNLPRPQTSDSPQSSGFLSAGQLVDRCREPAQTSASYCFAYIAAVHDMARAYEVWLEQREFCIPPATTQAELRNIFLAYAARNEQIRAGQAASAILVALKTAYPCVPVTPSPPVVAQPAPASR